MISIIICSREKTICSRLSENIKKTVGCNYELIIIDNSNNRFSLFQAYNIGIEKSIGKYVCFIHDDIFFHTNGWGINLLRIFNKHPAIGLIGVAGAKVKTRMPSAWWDVPEGQKVINIIQHFPNKEKEKWNLGFNSLKNVEVVVVDGVFMAARRVNDICFNENLEGFHNYDLNISFEYKKFGYRIIVTNEILLEHFSLGTLNSSWVNSTFKIHNLYNRILPLTSIKTDVKTEEEIINAKKFVKKSLKYNNYKVAALTWIKLFYRDPISGYHIQFWKRIFKNFLC